MLYLRLLTKLTLSDYMTPIISGKRKANKTLVSSVFLFCNEEKEEVSDNMGGGGGQQKECSSILGENYFRVTCFSGANLVTTSKQNTNYLLFLI